MLDLQEEYGISPAVGVILLLGITAALATIAGIVLLDIGDGLSQNAQAGVEVNETPEGVEITWETDSNADEIIIQANGQRYTLNSVNDSITLGLNEGSNVSVIGVIDGEESVISETTTESDTGDNTVENYNPGSTETLSGTVSVNPPINGATVRVVKNDTVLATTTTDSSGNYSVEAPENSRLEVVVENFTDTELSNPLYASAVRDVGSDLSSSINVDFAESDIQDVTVDGSTVSVINESYSGSKTIGTVEQLQAINADLSNDYMLLNDIDASETSSWNGGSGFEPIGTDSTPFTGDFNGENYTISQLNISRSSTSEVGLFGEIQGAIENVGITNADVTGDSNTGIVAGSITSESGQISNSYSTGTVTGSDVTGGLVGNYEGHNSVESVYSTAEVSGNNFTGGLIGKHYTEAEYFSDSQIRDSYAEGTVTSTGGSVGGLVGEGGGFIEGSYATGDVTADGRRVGGLVGSHFVGVQNTYSTGDVSSDDAQVGGLIGYSEAGQSSIDNNDLETETISNSHVSDISVTGTEKVGGLIGYVADGGTIDTSYAEQVTINGGNESGGLTGVNTADIIDSYAEGQIDAQVESSDVPGDTVGGLTGSHVNINKTITISQSYADTEIQNAGNQVGGLVGKSSQDISQSYADGSITSDTGGGLVGIQDGGSLRNSYAKTSVTSNRSGGVVSALDTSGTVENIYATGSISGSTSAGGVTESVFSGSVGNGYWDTESTTQSTSAGSSTGLTTSEMQGSSASSNLSGFDFTDVWTTTDGYPELQNNRE